MTAIQINQPHSIEVAGRLVGVNSKPILIDTGYWTDFQFGEIRRYWNDGKIFCFLSSATKNTVYRFEEVEELKLYHGVFNLPYSFKFREEWFGSEDAPVFLDDCKLFKLFRYGREWYVTNPVAFRPMLQRAIETTPEGLFEAIEQFYRPTEK